MRTATLLLLLGCTLSTVPGQAQDTPPAAPAAALPEGLRIVRFELAGAVEAREPVDVGTSFAVGAKVYVFLELANLGEGQELLVRFEREGGKAAPAVTLSVPVSKRYRTYSFTSPRAAGHYRAVVTTREGQVVAEKAFDVAAG